MSDGKILLFFVSLMIIGMAWPVIGIKNFVEVDKGVYDKIKADGFVKVWIYLKPSFTKDGFSDLLSTFDNRYIHIVRDFSYENSFTAYVNEFGVDSLINSGYISKISPVKKMYSSSSENIKLIQADKAWLLTNNGSNVTGAGQGICIIDSGVDTQHTYFSGKIVAQKCFCRDGLLSGCCPPDNSDTSDNATDDNGHGTNVAGIALSNGTLKGVATNSKLIAVKVVNSLGIGDLDDLKMAVDWCIQNKNTFNISVISMSLTNNDTYASSCDQVGQEVTSINNASTNNSIVVIVSSGDSGDTTGVKRPACASGAVSVGASYDSDLGREPDTGTYKNESSEFPQCFDLYAKSDSMVCFTSRGNILSLLAPGRLIESAGMGGGTSTYSGASQAAPHVAGLAALMKQANGSLTPLDIQTIMNYTGKPIYDPATQPTFRRIDAFRSVLAVLYNLFVSDLQVVGSNAGNRVFQFKAFNDLAVPANVSWSISYGDGGFDNSTSNATLGGYQEAFVFTSHDYARPGNYTVTAYANSSDSSNTLSMTIEARPIEVNTLKLLNQSSLRNVYGFNIKAPESDLNVSWVFYPKDGVAINSTQNISLMANQTIFVYFEYNYGSTGMYNVTANATDADKRYFDFNNITVNVI